MTTREFYESIGASYDSVLVRFGSEKTVSYTHLTLPTT